MYKRYRQEWTKHLDFIVVEEISLQIAYLLAMLLRFGSLQYSEGMYKELALVLLLFDFVVVMCFNSMHNVLKRGFFTELVETAKACVGVFALAVVYMYAFKVSSDYSRILLFVTLIFHIIISYSTRLLWKVLIRNTHINDGKKYSMLAVLDPGIAESTLKVLTDNRGDNYNVVGLVFTGNDERTEVCGVPVVSDIEHASEYICREWIDSVYVECQKITRKIDRFMEDCHQMTVTVHFSAPSAIHMYSSTFGNRVAGMTVLTSTVRYASPIEHAIKRTFDLIGGLIGSILACIIILIVGPIIKKKSPGPVLYTQERIGRNGKKFKMYKIRSMHVNADEIKEELKDKNRSKDGYMFKMENDPRVIKGIGEFIRKKSLDEFPQFFNVLLGQMSLVGTRPPTVDEWEKYKFHHRARLACKPGITGIWQTSGRSKITDFEEVVKLDTQYITDWTISMDIRLILKTAWMVVVGDEGAM